MQPTRRLAAILFTDIVGSTSMMQKDEQHAVSINRRYVAVLKECVLLRGGEILNDFGDGSLCTFHSATEALRCAIKMQQKFQLEPKVPLRIGLHIGEIFFEDGKVFGDGVNVASRVQSLGIANSILFSSEINSKIKNQQEFKCVSIGKFHFKNVDEPMEVFALSNEGLTVPKKEEIEGKLKNEKYSKRKIIIYSVLVLFVIASFFTYTQLFKTSFTDNKSIAILPFKIIGTSEDGLSDGLVEDIIAHLVKIKELKIISNRSSVQYKDLKKDLKAIGEDLDVNSLVTGSIQQVGNMIKVSTQLIDSKSGDVLWTDVYERDKIQIFDLQTELASQIVNALKAKLTSEEKSGLSKQYTENVEAYKLYRKGLYFWNKRTKASFDTAEVYYKKAIDLDPEYALAYSGLADCYALNNKGLSTAQALPIANAYLPNALSLDSNLAEALTTVGFIRSHFEYDWKGGKAILEKAIRLSPNYPTAHLYYGNIFIFNGDAEDGLNEIKKALGLDPLSISLNWSLGSRYYNTRRYDLAIAQLQKTLTLDPNNAAAQEWICLSLLQKKSFSQAIEAINKIPDTIPERGLLLCYAYGLSDNKVKAW